MQNSSRAAPYPGTWKAEIILSQAVVVESIWATTAACSDGVSALSSRSALRQALSRQSLTSSSVPIS